MKYTTTLTQNGQMTLPKHIRDLMKASPGTRLRVSWENGQAVISLQDNAKRLQNARKDSIAHLKKQGLYGLNDEQFKAMVAKQRTEYYGKKYGVS